MLLCFTLLMLDAVLFCHRRPQPDRQVAFGDAESLALDVGQRADAAALAGDDGIGRLVEQHEHRLDLRAALLVLVAKSHQRVDVDQGEIAGACRDARNRVRRSAGDVGRDRKRFRAEQAAGGGHHERRCRGIDRTVERELDLERGPGLVRGQDIARHQARNCAQPGKGSQENPRANSQESAQARADGVGPDSTHRGYISTRWDKLPRGDDCFVTSPTA